MRSLFLALATALLFTASAAAVDGTKELSGSIASLSATVVTVKDGSTSATCSIATASPSLREFHVGDRVAVVCKRVRDRWTLVAIRKLVTKPKADDAAFKQGGKLTDVSAASVTVRDGDHDFVCKRGDASPPLDGYHVGDRVVIVCKGGALVGITRIDAPAPKDPPKTPAVERTGQGTITLLTSEYITVHTDGGNISCHVGDGSPKLGDYHVGDRVKFGCRNDVLTALAKVETTPAPTPAPAPPVVERYATGTIGLLSAAYISVHTDGGDVACRITDGSPKLGDYHVGDRVKIFCRNDALTGIARL